MSEVRPETASTRVHHALRRQILEGELAPGERIPSERGLAEQFKVNRHAVREALKRLQQAGLIVITHGGATRVLDWRDSGGLEVLLDLGADSSDPPAEIVRSVLEMRASIGVDAARLCAERAGESQRENVAALGERAAELVEDGTAEELDEAFAGFWLAIVDGAGNIAYRLALNSLLAAMLSFGNVLDQIRPTDADLVRDLARAIEAGDSAASTSAASRMLRADIERAA